MKSYLSLTFAGLLSLALFSSVQAADTPMRAMAGKSLSRGDKSFLEKAAKSGAYEVAISQGVMDHLTNPDVKNFAQMMVTDHTAANNELMALAAQKNFTLPDNSKDVMEKREKWSKKTKNVDYEYMNEMTEDHDEAVKLFEKAAKSDDADVAAFASKTLPTLQHHHEMAQGLKKSFK